MAGELPAYIARAAPSPPEKRAAWYRTTAPTYAAIFLWFGFWDAVPRGGEKLRFAGGALGQGLGPAFAGLALAALIACYLFYLAPARVGMKTGLPLSIVSSSTYGAAGALLMPGLLMGLLQLGFLGINSYFAALFIHNSLADILPEGILPEGILSASPLSEASDYPVPAHAAVAAAWALLAASVGVKGIRVVARVAAVLPLVPLGVLLFLAARTASGIPGFSPAALIEGQQAAEPGLAGPLSAFGVAALIAGYVAGYFASAGAAGADFGMTNRNGRDVHLGGLVGISLAITVAVGLGFLIVAGGHGKSLVSSPTAMKPTDLLGAVAGEWSGPLMLLLALASFPGACFATYLASNSLRTTLPRVRPAVSMGIGALLSILLAASGLAGKLVPIFGLIGASFGPICGAMLADHLVSRGRWAGPRAGLNPAGWISWAAGFAVGILPHPFIPEALRVDIPAAPVAACLTGALVYALCARLGLESRPLLLDGRVARESAAAKGPVIRA